MTETQYDANDILMGGGGAPTARFSQDGTTIGGPIVAKPRAHQEREYDKDNPGNGAPKFFPSGDPIMGLTIDVQTGMRDPSVSDDTGVRRIYVEGKRLKEAVRNAIRAAGAPGLEVAGEVYVTMTGREPDERGQITVLSPKLWSVRYVPAASAILGVQQPVQQAPAFGSPAAAQPTWSQPAAAPVAQAAPPVETQTMAQALAPVAQPAPAAAPVAAVPTPEAVAAVRAAGLDPATVFPGYTG